MDALLIYGSDSSSDADDEPPLSSSGLAEPIRSLEGLAGQTESSKPGQQSSSTLPIFSASAIVLPPPPEDLLTSATPGSKLRDDVSHGGRVRSFPHVAGNYALHVYIPVTLPSYAKNGIMPLLERAMIHVPGLQLMEEWSIQTPSSDSRGAGLRSGNAGGLKLSGEYHISLSRTVPIRIHQIESITTLLHHKLSSQKRYVVDFGCWEVFMNDERTRTFLSLEITSKGLSEIQKQVLLVDEVFKLHNLPIFYKNPRPHISLAWALGDVTSALTSCVDELNKLIAGTNKAAAFLCSTQVTRVDCKIGQRVSTVWASSNP